ncbi:hypothetical protein [Mesorhizobium sp. B2-3-5]|uniref:hypothetical protein n=1 Tax=Mesorhizobium sp. B2-3-5 TaxID=2589958 RepID=UPI0011278ADA|nr:hypothetical protein [Mesorhizobium sp. B2-3-5]TPM21748.1 hypothetical protein FJ958_25575 [Mesorhizobium sp. B2-3-5]
MSDAKAAETEILRNVAAELKSDGYDVVLEPPPGALPPALKDLHPDAIAIGREPNLVIEVTGAGQQATDKVRALREAVSHENGWVLRVIYNSGAHEKRLSAPSIEELFSTYEMIPQLQGIDERAALLTGWAVLEGLSRSVDPTQFEKRQTPGRIVERMSAMGQLRREESDLLRKLATKRNDYIHGGLDTVVTNTEVSRFSRVLARLLKEAQRRVVPTS